MYAKLQNGTVIDYPVNIQTTHPNVSFPIGWEGGTIEGHIYARVSPTPRPEVSHTKNVVEGQPILIDGTWTQVWTETNASSAEIADRLAVKWAAVRQERNTLLEKSDWTQLPDAPLSSAAKTQWQAYRQDLRDLPEQADPFALTWPVQPS